MSETKHSLRVPIHFTGLPQSSRCPGDDRLLRIVLALVAKAAADVGRHQPDCGLRQLKLLANRAPDVMRHLGGAIECQLTGRRCRRRGRARFDRRADQAVVDEIEPHHMGGAAKGIAHGGLIAASEAKANVARRIASCKCGASFAHRGFGIDHRLQRLIIHMHEVGCVTCLAAKSQQ